MAVEGVFNILPMNLASMAQFICDKVRKTDTDSLAKCKNFIRQRDQMLYDAHLWRSSLYEFTKQIDPINVTLHAIGIVMLPDCIDKVIAVRSDRYEMKPENLETFFQTSFDYFSQVGAPMQYSLLSPVVNQLATPKPMLVKNESASDNGLTVTVRYIDDSNSIKRSTVTLNGASQQVGTGNVKVIEGFDKPATVGIVHLYSNAVYSGGWTWIDDSPLNPTDTSAEKLQRLRLFSIPDIKLSPQPVLRILVKKKYDPMQSDSEESRLGRGAENALMAYAIGDMLERSRQFGKAQSKFQEAASLAAGMSGIEYEQQSNRMRFIPSVEPMADSATLVPTKSFF